MACNSARVTFKFPIVSYSIGARLKHKHIVEIEDKFWVALKVYAQANGIKIDPALENVLKDRLVKILAALEEARS
jgi:hypothetical protein